MSDSELIGAGASTYANIFTYMGLPLTRSLKDCDAVVMGLPYDLATSARPGARFGPNAIRQASAQLRWEEQRWPWSFRLAERMRVVDYGDLDFEVGNSGDMVAAATEHASRISAAGKFLLTFGGDHFVSLPLLRGIAAHHGKLALLHFDAHTDTEVTELEFYHGSMFYHAQREGLFAPQHSIQLGIRTEYNNANHDLLVLHAPEVNSQPVSQTIAEINKRVGDLPVYLSIDIDCLDPAYAPGTGTPVVGGMTTDTMLQVLRGLGSLNIVAADVTEVAPAYDNAQITALAAATIGLETLYLKAS